MAKKGSKKRPTGAPAGVNKQELRQQRLESRRAAKAEAEARRRKQQQRERLVRMGIFALIVVTIFWFIFLRNTKPGEINGHQIAQFSTAGTSDHTNDPVTYETSPGVSGFHAPRSIACGIYDSEIPDETQVHMLEHGAVGIQYQPTLDPAQIEDIEAVVEASDGYVFSAPYSAMQTPITVSSWSRLMTLDTFDKEAVEEYIDVFAGEGPEAGQQCPNEADSPFEPQPTVSPVPTESPAPEASPTEEAGEGKDGKNGKGENSDDQ